MKKQELKEENERLKQQLVLANKELRKIKDIEEHKKINSILNQLKKDFGFDVVMESFRSHGLCINYTTETYTLKRQKYEN